MENYKTVSLIGKGTYGCANLVISLLDNEKYIMKVTFFIKKNTII